MHEVFRLPVADRGEQLLARLAAPNDHPRRPAILYLHGFGSHQGGVKAEFFRRRAVKSGFVFCSFDFRGHGASDGNTLDLSLSRNLAEVKCVRQELAEREIGPVILFGSSFGGLTALWHTLQHPEGIAAGLAIAPALGFARALEQLLGRATMRRWREDGRLRFINEVGEADVGWEMVADLRRYDEDELAERLQTPFLIFQGQQDDRVDWRRVCRFVEQCRRGVALELFPDGDHRLLDKLDVVWQRSLEFLRVCGVS